MTRRHFPSQSRDHRQDAPVLAQPINALIRTSLVAFDQLLFLELSHLAKQAVSIRPSFVRIGKIAESGPHKVVRGPKQEVQEFGGFWFHRSKEWQKEFRSSIPNFVAYATKFRQPGDA